MKESFGRAWDHGFKVDKEAPLDALPTEEELEKLTIGQEKRTIVRDPNAPTRRDVLSYGSAALTALTLRKAGKQVERSGENAVEQETVESLKESAVPETHEVPARTVKIPTGKLAGRKVGDLFAFYLGLPPSTDTNPSAVPKELTVNFGKVLDDIWKKKVAYVHKHKPDWEKNTEAGRKIFSERYTHLWNKDAVDKRTMPDVISRADEIISGINTQLDWDSFNAKEWSVGKKTYHAPYTHLSDTAVSLVKQLSEKVTGEMLMAYSITELMPSVTDNKFNVEEYAFLLENAGVEFMVGAPAIHDPYLSAGMFQFTSFAVYSKDGERHGASIPNLLLPENERIPGSMSKLDSLDLQQKAAHLFAINNIAHLVQSIITDPKHPERKTDRLLTLIRNKNTIDVSLLQYIASAHHNPSEALQAFKAWLDVDMRGSHAAHATKSLAEYIHKSNGNYGALKALTAQA